MSLSLRTAGRIASRETRSSMTKFLFVVLAVAAGVGALAGVRGFSQSFRSALTDESRTVMGADLTARQFVAASDEGGGAGCTGRPRGRSHAHHRDDLDGVVGHGSD